MTPPNVKSFMGPRQVMCLATCRYVSYRHDNAKIYMKGQPVNISFEIAILMPSDCE
jgi:hypothetical protein